MTFHPFFHAGPFVFFYMLNLSWFTFSLAPLWHKFLFLPFQWLFFPLKISIPSNLLLSIEGLPLSLYGWKKQPNLYICYEQINFVQLHGHAFYFKTTASGGSAMNIRSNSNTACVWWIVGACIRFAYIAHNLLGHKLYWSSVNGGFSRKTRIFLVPTEHIFE